MRFSTRFAYVAVLLFMPGASAAGLQDVDADLEYLQAGAFVGKIGSPGAFVLHSGSDQTGPPKLSQFLLKADTVDVVLVRRYEDGGRIVQRDTLNELLGPAGLQEEEKTYRAVDLRLLEATHEWNFLVFRDTARRAEPASLRSLGAADFELSNVEPGKELISPQAPRGATLERYLSGAGRTAPGQLRLTSESLVSESSGAFNLVLYGATVRLSAIEGIEEIVTGHHRVTETGPLGIPVEREVNDIVVLKVHGGNFRLLHQGAGLSLYSHRFDVTGRLQLADATGRLAIAEHENQLQGERVDLDGSLQLAARGAPRHLAEGRSYGPLRVSGQAYAEVAPVSPPAGLIAAAAVAAVAATSVAFLPGARRFLLGVVGLFSMVGKEDALRHEARQHLLEHIRNNPGTTLSCAQRDLGMGWGTIGYHVSVLERLGYVVTKRVGGKRLLFAQGQSRLADPAAWGLLQNPSVRALVDAHLARGEALTASQGAQTLGCTSQYAGRLLRRLAAAGLAVAQGSPHRAVYGPSPLLEQLGIRPSAPVADAAAPAMAPPEVPALAASSTQPAPGALRL